MGYIRIAKDDIDIISVIVFHWGGGVHLRFFENSCDSHNLASVALNNTKFNV